MSDIPPALPASAAQGGIQAGDIMKEREARRSGQVEAARRQVQTVDEAGETVDTQDDDVAIFTDAEGSGSQGREEEEARSAQQEEPVDASEGMTQDGEGRLHIDLEA